VGNPDPETSLFIIISPNTFTTQNPRQYTPCSRVDAYVIVVGGFSEETVERHFAAISTLPTHHPHRSRTWHISPLFSSNPTWKP
jgi:hypothetical protein